MWLRYVALCLGVSGWLLRPSLSSAVSSPSHLTNEPEQEEDTSAALTTANNAKPDVMEAVACTSENVEGTSTVGDPTFVCYPPSLLRLRSRDVYMTTQEEQWTRDEYGHMYLSQTSKRVLVQCPTSENEFVLQRMTQGGFNGARSGAMVPTSTSPSAGPASPAWRQRWMRYFLDNATTFVNALLEYAVKCMGTAILMSTCAIVWNYSLGINADLSFHDLIWKHLQDA
ncbi:hypothetical protein DYB35_013719 [Aphanomyces astaci]|uniref:Uncharacterized protein n=1 Tax=Aphanomyces astaci TaxID=112090 RepID=A0A3R7AT46_APHAT|nr:hypothetical protein DYB35_013719 [Aphanomyces astaci]